MSRSTQTGPLSTTQATILVAEREVTTQIRTKSFIISALVTVVIIVGGIIALNVFGGGDDAEEVAVVDGVVLPEHHNEAPAPGMTALHPVQADSMDQAEQLLRKGEVEAIITGDEQNPVGLRVIGLDSAPTGLAQTLSVAPTLQTLEDPSDDGLQFLVAMVFGLVFMVLGLGSGMMIVQNTVQEKQSRVVEILLSAISSRALLAGKVIGNSILAVGQAIVYAAASLVTLLATGQTDVLGSLTRLHIRAHPLND